METYRQGYEVYRKACKNYGLPSLHFHLFLKQLTPQQLEAYNKYEQKESLIECLAH